MTKDSWRPDYVVGLTRGGLLPAVLISQYLDCPMEALTVSLRDASRCVSDCGMASDAFGYVNLEIRKDHESWSDKALRKNILIVDDINDTGATLNWIKQDWQSNCLPHAKETWGEVWGNNVRVAVLIDNLPSKSELTINYAGMEINKQEDPRWVNFPYENWWKK
jgi:xanthine phosphoribosyltransferase